MVVSLWEETSATGRVVPYYSITSDGRESAPHSTSYDIMLRAGRFDPLKQPAPRADFDDGVSPNVFIVQFHTPPLPEFQAKLTALGATIHQFMPSNALLVKMSPSVRTSVGKLSFVRWVGPFLPSYRIEEPVRDGLVTADQGGAILPPTHYNIMAFERGRFDELTKRIAELGGTVHLVVPEGFRVEATLTEKQLRNVIQMDPVHFIDRWAAAESDVVQEREIGGANYVADTAGFTGEGVRAEVFDGGLRTTHVEFQRHPVINHGTFGLDNHGSSTFGINFASGDSEPRARGLVPDAQGIFAAYNTLRTGHTRYQHTSELVRDPYFAVYQSNSWGDGLTGAYTTISAEMDDILFINDFVLLNSMSNYGSRTSVRPQAWAKNVVSIGGLTMTGLDPAGHCWCRKGSIGPAADGRIKPDLSHAFSQVYSTSGSNDTSYNANFGGTSAATPVVAGHFGIFFQMWHQGIFGNPVRDTVFNSRPHMTTAKAVMINTATQWDFEGQDDDRTRNHLGWGFPNVQTIYDGRDNIFIVNETDVLAPLQTRTYRLVAQANGTPLRATLVYKDPMGSPAATLERINDLSLRVTAPSGSVFWGNAGLLDSNLSWEGGDEDHINTVENVFVVDPESGTWTIDVIGTEINVDTHPATPQIDADYALVVSGVNR